MFINFLSWSFVTPCTNSYRLSASLSSVLINIDKLPPPPEEVTADIHTVPNIFNIKPQTTESSEEIVTRRDSIVPNKKMKKSTEPDTVFSTSRQNGFVCNAQLKGPLSPLPSVTSSQNGSANYSAAEESFSKLTTDIPLPSPHHQGTKVIQ